LAAGWKGRWPVADAAVEALDRLWKD